LRTWLISSGPKGNKKKERHPAQKKGKALFPFGTYGREKGAGRVKTATLSEIIVLIVP